jgi:hypothetical protein
MTSAGTDEARFRLTQLMVRDGADLLATQPWAMEDARWAELAFALMSRLSRQPDTVLRDLVDELAGIGLLDVATLAAGPDSPGGEAAQRRLVQVMQERGLEPAEAARVARGLGDLARGLQQHFAGRAQRYLRHYAEAMLRDLDRWFACTELTREELADVVTYWLQNAAVMPVSLVDESVRAFCDEFGFTTRELIDAADDLGLNLGLLDDLTLLHANARRLVPEPRHQHERPASTGTAR